MRFPAVASCAYACGLVACSSTHHALFTPADGDAAAEQRDGRAAEPSLDAMTPSVRQDAAIDSGAGSLRDAAAQDAGSDAAIDCSAVKLDVTRVTPMVMLLVDGSSSMEMNFYPPDSMTTRWMALRTAVLGDDGVVPSMQGLVKFGLAIFGSVIAGDIFTPPPPESCPLPLGVVPPALNQNDEISLRWPAVPPGTFTPTGLALDAVLSMWGPPAPDAEPHVIVLATDGNPNDCMPMDFMTPNYQATIDAALRAQAQQTKLYVISLGTDADHAHLQQVANIGAGLPADMDPGAPLYYPENVQELTDTLRELVGGELSCEVLLAGDGVDPDQQCAGSVLLNGELVACDPDNGYRLNDATHLELLGAACERLNASADVSLDVTFPCKALR